MNEVNQSQVETQVQKQKEVQRRRGKARAAADGPPAMPAPEQVVELLRGLSQSIVGGTRLTPKQRRAFQALVRASRFALQSSISIIGASDNVSQAVGQPAGDVRQKVDESNRWTAVEDELRSLLAGVSDANLTRRYEIALITGQAYFVGKQLARNPENAAGLQPHLQEVKRLKSMGRSRKRATETPEQPSPQAPSTATASDTSAEYPK